MRNGDISPHMNRQILLYIPNIHNWSLCLLIKSVYGGRVCCGGGKIALTLVELKYYLRRPNKWIQMKNYQITLSYKENCSFIYSLCKSLTRLRCQLPGGCGMGTCRTR